MDSQGLGPGGAEFITVPLRTRTAAEAAGA